MFLLFINMNKRGENERWALLFSILPMIVIVALLVKTNSLAYDTKTYNLAKTTEIGYAIDQAHLTDGNLEITINLPPHKKDFSINILNKEVSISDKSGTTTYHLNKPVSNSLNLNNPDKITIKKINNQLEVY